MTDKKPYADFQTVSLTIPGEQHRSLNLSKSDNSGFELLLTRHHFGGVSVFLNPEEVEWLREHLPPLRRYQTTEEARKIIERCGDWIGHITADDAPLDGRFTREELEAVLTVMRDAESSDSGG